MTTCCEIPVQCSRACSQRHGQTTGFSQRPLLESRSRGRAAFCLIWGLRVQSLGFQPWKEF